MCFVDVCVVVFFIFFFSSPSFLSVCFAFDFTLFNINYFAVYCATLCYLFGRCIFLCHSFSIYFYSNDCIIWQTDIFCLCISDRRASNILSWSGAVKLNEQNRQKQICILLQAPRYASTIAMMVSLR